MTLGNPVEPQSGPGDSSAYSAQSAEMVISLASAQVINDYLGWMRSKRLADSTLNTARNILHALAWRVGTNIIEAGEDGLRRWQQSRAEDLQPRSLRSQIVYVRGFYRWAAMTGRLAKDPSWVLAPPRMTRLLPHPMPDDDLARALEAADGDLLAVLALAGFAGARACEISTLDWSDVVLVGRRPRLRLVGKGGHERIVDIAPALYDALSALPQRRGPVIRRRDGGGGRVSPARVSSLANRFLAGLGIRERLHGLRHRFGTRVYEESRDLRATQEALGHASVSTTAGYAAIVAGSVRVAILAAGELRPDEDEQVDSPRRSVAGGDVHPTHASGTGTPDASRLH